jgi:hypothetical protein
MFGAVRRRWTPFVGRHGYCKFDTTNWRLHFAECPVMGPMSKIRSDALPRRIDGSIVQAAVRHAREVTGTSRSDLGEISGP